MQHNVTYQPLTAADFLGNQVHGDNYLTPENLTEYQRRAQSGDVNLNWLAFVDGQLAGIRLTFAPGTWPVDGDCSPQKWPFKAQQLCYFKCSAVDARYRGLGIGKGLLLRSIDSAKQLGCLGGLAHIWLQSPGNSAYEYFSRCGGVMINEHANRWYDLSISDGYHCPVCDGVCYCSAGEMLLSFDNVPEQSDDD
ncbi:GNAT family N-acetyltransferase [Idiomarina xiamenensis]|uniref:Acetyltransferase n=1 Tax=Idiomarina xiamenensis 10-D-4 TaxID=740709 RepID=K2KSD7_9GAMM|nr:GNAT family N-acetyltransferase [Idiomarina xiamenensis]EKE85284.1 acetyltransferase [Idiomarina xiamenensis 10-D-4]